MANENVFEKKHGEDDVLNDVSGVLDHLNLPPAFVEFVRKNLRAVQIAIGAVVVLVVFFSLYGSYREKKIDAGAQALALAVSQENKDAKISALEAVMKDFSSTSSSMWAKVELAHENMKNSKFSEAAGAYKEISSKVGEKDPLFALAVFGLAQAEEAANNLDSALSSYEKISSIPGYQGLGFAGAARVHEIQGNGQKALEVYELYLGELADYPASYPEKILVEEKLARLRTAKNQ